MRTISAKGPFLTTNPSKEVLKQKDNQTKDPLLDATTQFSLSLSLYSISARHLFSLFLPRPPSIPPSCILAFCEKNEQENTHLLFLWQMKPRNQNMPNVLNHFHCRTNEGSQEHGQQQELENNRSPTETKSTVFSFCIFQQTNAPDRHSFSLLLAYAGWVIPRICSLVFFLICIDDIDIYNEI